MVTSLTPLSLVSTKLVPAEVEDPDLYKFRVILDKWHNENRDRWVYDATYVAQTMYQMNKRPETKLELERRLHMKHLPEDAINMMTHLTEIIFYDMPNCRFPTSMQTLTGLTKLIFANFAWYPDSFPKPFVSAPVEGLTNLRVLGLNKANFATVPTEIFGLTGLVVLSMMENKLESIPSALAALTNLTHLDFSGNAIQYPPAELGRLVQLREFNLHGNPVQIIPPQYGRLTNLTQLQFGCRFRQLPLSVKVLPCRGGNGFQISTLIEHFEESAASPPFLKVLFLNAAQERDLGLWLLRLARCKEYYNCQPQVAQIVCTMLQTLGGKKFREAFLQVISFPHQSEELLFDELFVLYQNMTLYRDQPTRFKLDKLEGVARTIALRKEIETRTNDLSEEKKIEAFHCAENRFYNELGLNKAILQSGQFYYGSSEELRKLVDAQYKQIMHSLPSYGFIK